MNNFERRDIANELPRVSDDTIVSTVEGMGDNPDYFAAAGEKLMTQQPELNDHIAGYIARRADTSGEHDKMIEVALFMYDALARQAESDALNQRLQ